MYAAGVLNDHFRAMNIPKEDIVIVSPDEGSIKRAVGHAKRLGGDIAIIDKRRLSADNVTQENIIGGPLEGKVALMFDDMISTAGSIVGAARSGAKERCAGDSRRCIPRRLSPARRSNGSEDAPIDSIVVTDSIPIPPEKRLPNMKVLSVAPISGRGDQANPPTQIDLSDFQRRRRRRDLRIQGLDNSSAVGLTGFCF